MRLISIECKEGKEVINTDQICRIRKSGNTVIITTGDDGEIETLFTDIDHAVDYIQRASSHSLGE
ncbi:MAG: hypothetical protein CBC29_06140 [Methylococcaceae bacterium TMED69]|nr:MAG: hypothetical protein CBC29_06140 [Methylococcaceae bacterium TMED69]|tara:strand:- start:178 stop:372 length:195 start_codon:yes stop_codon:yes gene_type:complete